MRALLILIIALGAALGVAVCTWAATKGHVLLFPLVLLFGVPLLPLVRLRR